MQLGRRRPWAPMAWVMGIAIAAGIVHGEYLLSALLVPYCAYHAIGSSRTLFRRDKINREVGE